MKLRGVTHEDLGSLLDVTEGAARHYTNGTRSPSLDQFMLMCDLAGADPATVLFGHPTIDKVALQRQREQLAQPHSPVKRPKIKEPA